MAHPMTQPLEPYEPDPSSEYGWDDDPETAEHKPKILWGRVAILGGMVLLAFLLGRSMASDGIPRSQLVAAEERIEALETENQALEEELASAPVATEDPSAGAETEPDATGTDETGAGAGSKTYVVESGDTLTTIAEKFYGDASLDDFLAEVNGITDPTELSVGQELTIPNDPPD